MALDVNRWLKYAKARIDHAVGQGNRSLDRREAEREVERADRPWLAADAPAPTLDEARARIEWEAERQRRMAAGEDGATAPSAPARPTTPAAPDAEQEAARLELEARERASAERLEAIRRELGVAEPAGHDEPDEPDEPAP